MAHTFDLIAMDGESIDILDLSDAMDEWLDEQGLTTASIEIKERLGALFDHGHFLRVTIEDTDHAMWFKMRWSPDVANYARKLAEDCAKRLSMFNLPIGSGGTIRFLPDPKPQPFPEWGPTKTVRPDATPPRLDGFAEIMPVASEYRRPVCFGKVTNADGTVGTLTPETQKRLAKKIEALLSQEMIDVVRG